MSKKTFTILVIAIVLIIAGVFWYLTRTAGPTTENNGENVQGGLFPAGQNQGGGSGQSGSGTGEGEATSTVIDLGNGQTAEAPRLRQLWNAPTAGVVAFDVGSSTLIRFIERATGHIYETNRDESAVTKISNTTLPKIHDAIWADSGNSLLIRYLKDDSIRTFYGQISTSSPVESSLEGLFLADNIQSISEKNEKIFYLLKSGSNSQGIVANMDDSKKVTVFDSSFGDWDSIWSGDKTVTLYPRPSGSVNGSAYILDSATGAYSKTSGDLPGLSALGNSDGSLVLLSGYNGNKGIVSGIRDVKAEADADAGITTLSDKCVWSHKEKASLYCAVPRSVPSALYPDDWYKGKVSFDDSVWKIDATTGETTEIFDPLYLTGSPQDIFDLRLDQSESTLVFRNKKDMTPWSYALVR